MNKSKSSCARGQNTSLLEVTKSHVEVKQTIIIIIINQNALALF